MPETLAQTGEILERLHAAGLHLATLLVVPGRDWQAGDLDELRGFCDAGAELAGHGWKHRADTPRDLKHRLHSLLISRNAAEHLSLTTEEITALIRRCHAWFAAHTLPQPDLYVPPAWAMGRLPRATLGRLPFRRYETLAGIYDAPAQAFTPSPMVGYETDTWLRALPVRAWNALNRAAAGGRIPLRVAIHPQDFGLKLADDLRRLIDAGGHALSYRQLDSQSA
jgi:predicted deacetylase